MISLPLNKVAAQHRWWIISSWVTDDCGNKNQFFSGKNSITPEITAAVQGSQGQLLGWSSSHGQGREMSNVCKYCIIPLSPRDYDCCPHDEVYAELFLQLTWCFEKLIPLENGPRQGAGWPNRPWVHLLSLFLTPSTQSQTQTQAQIFTHIQIIYILVFSLWRPIDTMKKNENLLLILSLCVCDSSGGRIQSEKDITAV